ncbi:MAG: adenylyltransferase/cytidyltransferase family protein [Myxococcales bacterium]
MKVVPLAEAVRAREAARAQGRKVAVANGAFDLLHVGHVRYLKAAKDLTSGGILVVGVNSDRSVRASKGEDRPVVPERERAEIVAALGCVDLVVLFDETDAASLLSALRPDLHVKGTDYTEGSVPERDVVARLGGRTVIAGDPKDHSTTDVLSRIRGLLR